MPVLLVALVCGGCGARFEANAYSVPQFRERPACPQCWTRINTLRVQLGLPAWDTPDDAYMPRPAGVTNG